MRDLFEEMQKMQAEMDKLFAAFFQQGMPLLEGPGKGYEKGSKEVTRRALCDVKETDKSVIATFEMPGAEKDKIELNVTEDSIEVKAQKKLEQETKDEKKGYYSFVSSASQFYRQLPLPAKVDADKTVAVYKDGILKVTMPKQAPSAGKGGKRVNIQ